MTAAPQFVQLGLLDAQPIVEPVTHRTHVRAHLRRVKGDAPPTGRQLRDAALTKHASDDAVKVTIEYVRAQLVALYRARVATWPSNQVAYVNADDVARIIREWPECPPAIHARKSQDWRGAVFRGKGWTKTGTSSPSLRPHMRATDLPGWRPVDDAAANPSPSRAQRRTA